MVERIRALLAERQLTPTQFADFIGVGRPIISHILSGRNKPSLEVIQKVINAFPDLALPWLLTGTGTMWGASEAVKPVQSQKAGKKPASRLQPLVPASPLAAAPAVSTPHAEPATPAVETPPTVVQTPLPAPFPAETAPPPPAPARAEAPPALPPVAAPVTPAGPASLALPFQALAEPDKAIRRIVIFYQDGTFSSFQPE